MSEPDDGAAHLQPDRLVSGHVCGPLKNVADWAPIVKEDSGLIVGLHNVAKALLGAPDDHAVEVRVTCRTCRVSVTPPRARPRAAHYSQPRLATEEASDERTRRHRTAGRPRRRPVGDDDATTAPRH